MEIRVYIVMLVGLLVTSTKGAPKEHNPASHYFKICHSSHPDYKTCLRRTIKELTPLLVDGVPELDIPAIDPLTFPRIEYHDKRGGIEFRSVHSNITIHGMRDYKLLDIDVDVKNLTMTLNTTIPFMRTTSVYEISGRILLLPIYGHGNSQFNFTDINTSCKMFGKLFTRDGVEYLKMHDVQLDVDISGAKVQLDNLFNGDKTLGDAANRVFNENWEEAFHLYKHLALESITVIFKSMTNKVLQKFPFSELYPV